jgi:hypothetical protein
MRPDLEKIKKSSGWLFAALLLFGAALRCWLVFHDDGVHHPDEIYQSLEPAHRLVFGYGLSVWEFTVGARNWAFPGFVALLMKLSSVVGLNDPRHYLLFIRLVFSAISLAAAYGSYRLARAYDSSRFVAVAGAALYAVAAPAIFFAPRAIPEGASAFLVVLGLAFALAPSSSSSKKTIGVSCLGLATLFRLQNGIFCVGLLAILFFRQLKESRLRRDFWQASILLLIWAFLFGLLDKLTWGHWFQSASVYLQFNLVEGKSAEFGTEPFTYYFHVLKTSLGPVFYLLIPLVCLSVLQAPGLFSVAAVFLLIHSLIPHKEMRFILPLYPILGALAAIGMSAIFKRLRRPFTSDIVFICTAAFIALSLFSGVRFHKLTEGDLHTDDDLSSLDSAYDKSGPVNRLLLVAYRQPDLCGIEIARVHLDWIGGYSYLHRKVPLYSKAHHDPKPNSFNYLIAPTGKDAPDPGGEKIASDGDFALFRLFNGPCTPDEEYDFIFR